MPSLAERRAQVAAQGGGTGDFIKFKTEGETKILRFLFTDATTIESHKKYWDEENKKWLFDDACPEGKGAYRITFNCVEYDAGGKNARRVRWELSEYLYNEYLSPYIEKSTPASQNVWEIKVRRPGTMDISYVAFKVDGATVENYPIPDAPTSNGTPATPAAQPAAAPTYAQPQAAAQQPAAAPAPQPAAQPTAPANDQPPFTPDTPAQAPRKNKYF